MTEIIEIKEIRKIIDLILKPMGFKKLGRRYWVRETVEMDQAFDLDHFRYEPKSRLMFLANVKRLGLCKSTEVKKFAISLDVSQLAGDPRQFMNAFDREYPFEPEARERIIGETLQGPLLPVLDRFETEAGSLALFLEIRNIGIVNIPPYIRDVMTANN